MTRSVLVAAALLAGLSAPPASAADLWGIEGEKAVLLKGRVVDLLCEVGKVCAPDCGGGRRQLGLVDGTGRLYPAAKGNTLFAGAVADLAPYCGREVEVDGLVIESPRMHLLFVQKLKAPATPTSAPPRPSARPGRSSTARPTSGIAPTRPSRP